LFNKELRIGSAPAGVLTGAGAPRSVRPATVNARHSRRISWRQYRARASFVEPTIR